MRTTSKTYLALSLLLACGPISSGTTGTASTEPDDTSSSTSSTGDLTTGGPLCSPSAFCDSDDDCPETAHCSVFGVCATECDPTCSPECMTADPPCPAPCDKQCATGCTASGECMLCDVGDTGGTGGSSTGEPACEAVQQIADSPVDVSVFCDDHPFDRPEACEKQPLLSCSDILGLMAASTRCDDLTLCEYQACADAMANGPCDVRPDACTHIAGCIDIPEPPPPPHACSPGFCDDFDEVSLGSGLDPEFADELGKICDWDPCRACDEVETACGAAPCPAIQSKCEAEMATCDCS